MGADAESAELGHLITSSDNEQVQHGMPTVSNATKLGGMLLLGAGASLCALCAFLASGAESPFAKVSSDALIEEVAAEDDPNWGCGLVGVLPGVTQDGEAAKETQMLIDAIKGSSTFNKASYWNWNVAPQTDDGAEQHLTKDFIFMPEEWGVGPTNEKYVREAGKANFLDSNGKVSPATMADIFLGSNEPDITGSCMGNMFGSCKRTCSDANVQAGNCPICYLHSEKQSVANSDGECNCWQYSHATGVGFWPVNGCEGTQPLPEMWKDPACVDVVMDKWKKTAAIAVSKGYKYLTTPLVAENMEYAKDFLLKACQECHDASCGCPQYVGFHFYAYDCQPERLGGYRAFRARMQAVADLMDDHPFVKGAIINEVGMLNCAGQMDNPICIPDSGTYPASEVHDNSCPGNEELPDGLATFIEKLFDMIIDMKTKDGRSVVKGFSWFNENMAGGTYNLQLFDEDGSVNKVGHAYMRGCTKWAEAQKAHKKTA